MLQMLQIEPFRRQLNESLKEKPSPCNSFRPDTDAIQSLQFKLKFFFKIRFNRIIEGQQKVDFDHRWLK